MIEIPCPRVETPTPSTLTDTHSDEGLNGTLGVFDLTMTVLAASAPLSVMAAFVPVSMIVGNGTGMVQSFLISGVVLVLFAFGFLAMGQRIAREGGDAGAFYAYVARGLGRPAGLGGAFLAVIGYTFLQTATYGMLGMSVADYMRTHLGLVAVPWWLCAFGFWAVVGALGYRRIDLSAKLLGIAMLGEIAIVGTLDFAVLVTGGTRTLGAEPFTQAALLSGNPALGVMFAAATFLGFEATAIYSEEARNPRRTIPFATFLSLGLIALFYAGSTYCLIAAYGPGSALAEARASPTTMFATALSRYVGKVMADGMYVLLITSLFAAILSFHNAVARYFFSFGVDGVLPAVFGRTHARHGSPAAGSLLQSVTALCVVAPFALLGRDPVLELYAWGAGVGTMAMLLLMAIASVAIMRYLGRHADEPWWRRRAAPALAFVGLSAIALYASANFKALVGASLMLSNAFLLLVYLTFFAGVMLALRWRRTRPDCYARIGRL